MNQKLTLAEKVWRDHVVQRGDAGAPDLIFIDFQLLHEVTSPQAFDGLRLAGRTLRHPELHLATEDHNVPTQGIKTGNLLEIKDEVSRTQVSTSLISKRLPDLMPCVGTLWSSVAKLSLIHI